MSWKLKVKVELDGVLAGNLAFAHSPVSIGSAANCDVVLSHPYVSREHAIATVSGGHIHFRDRSSNGSFMSGGRVSDAVLGSGGVISIPPYELTFELIEEGGASNTVSRPDSRSAASPESLSLIMRPELLKTKGKAGTKTFSLRMKQADGHDTRYDLDAARGPVVIGRAPDAGLHLEFSTLSRKHAAIAADENGVFTLSDLKSANGVAVNGKRLESAVLKSGDEISLGPDVTLEFATGKSEPQAASQLPGPDASLRLTCLRRGSKQEVLIVNVAGRVDGYTYTELKELLTKAIDDGERYLVIDMSATSFLDHSGLGVLVNTRATLAREEGHLRLVGLPQRLKDGLALLRLDQILDLRADLQQALDELLTLASKGRNTRRKRN